jgi:hypothetical protein
MTLDLLKILLTGIGMQASTGSDFWGPFQDHTPRRNINSELENRMEYVSAAVSFWWVHPILYSEVWIGF